MDLRVGVGMGHFVLFRAITGWHNGLVFVIENRLQFLQPGYFDRFKDVLHLFESWNGV